MRVLGMPEEEQERIAREFADRDLVELCLECGNALKDYAGISDDHYSNGYGQFYSDLLARISGRQIKSRTLGEFKEECEITHMKCLGIIYFMRTDMQIVI